MKLKKTSYLLMGILAVFSLTACQSDRQTASNNKIDEHSAEYALDYQGVYKGTIPCADCSGIQITLTLNKDKTFIHDSVYLEKKNGHFVDKGNYQVKDNILTLKLDPRPLQLRVGESALFYLNGAGKPVEGYKLIKQK